MNNVHGKCHSTLKCVKDVISQPISYISTRYIQYIFPHTVVAHYQSINPLACTECDDSLPFSGASSIPPCHTLFPATLLCRPFFHPPSLHPAICFLVYLLVLLFPNSYTILFWESYFLPFSVHVKTIVIYAALLSLL